MINVASFLPAPTQAYGTGSSRATHPGARRDAGSALSNAAIPAYGTRARASYRPRAAADFGDGGAFPELRMPQYPRGMGQRGGDSASNSTVLAKRYDEHGDVAYDAVAKAGRHGKTTFSKFTDLIEAPVPDAEENAYARPDADEIEKNMAATRAALESRIQTKIQSAMPVQSRAIAAQTKAAQASQFIRYTPGEHAASGGNSSGARQRVIRMVTAQVDPLEPPKFKHNKAPGGPPSPPPPVMHSPPRKVTVEDQKAWKIPPCISNWKNSRGYTIALDKRVAADGRGLQQATINDKFAQFAESLQIAEQKAREEVERRAQFERQALVEQKNEQESQLREIAQQARQIRSGGGGEDGSGGGDDDAARRAAAAARARAGDDLSSDDDR
jgi:SNW domain-containing protein 1